MSKDKKYRCPNCNSENLIVREETSFKMNTMEFYCHSKKAHDSDANVTCIDCWWEGTRRHVDPEN